MLFTRFSSYSLIILAAMALTACTGVETMPNSQVRGSTLSTQAMPKGYRFQDNSPLSSPAPSSPWFKSSEITDTEKMSTNTAAWQGAVFELVAKIEPQLPKDGTPLRLVADKYSIMNNSHDISLDHHLRQTLLQKGYNLTTVPDAGLQVGYKTSKAKEKDTYLLTAVIKTEKDKDAFEASVPAVLPNE